MADVTIGTLDGRRPLGADNPDLTGYLATGSRFCPYVRPSLDAGAFYQSRYPISELAALSPDGRAAEGLLYVGIIHAEWMRARRAAADPKTQHLICDTLLVAEDAALGWKELAAVVMWPQCILKYLYSGVGLMFANFWRGYTSEAADGRSIPPPPKTFFAIRSAVPARDSRFLGADPLIAGLIRESLDDGRDVHSPVAPIDAAPLSAAALSRARYFDRARDWVLEQSPDLARETAGSRARAAGVSP
jgi:hypothetical protein